MSGREVCGVGVSALAPLLSWRSRMRWQAVEGGEFWLSSDKRFVIRRVEDGFRLSDSKGDVTLHLSLEAAQRAAGTLQRAPSDELVTLATAADRLGVSKQALYKLRNRWTGRGFPEATVRVGKRDFWEWSSLLEWYESERGA